ncbi:MAG: carboxypeptidase regulatory-like domain-containing protein, partial [Gemmatimonadaceae bacterium]
MISRLLWYSIWFGFFASSVAAQDSSRVAGTAIIRGTVYDSLTRRALTGASVQILGTSSGGIDRSTFSRFATTNEAGVYQFEEIPSGVYVLGFFYPSLDSLGLDLPLRTVTVQPAGNSRVDLAVPSHAGAIGMLCGRGAISDTTALIVGFVRDATTSRAAEGASVLLQWTELVIGGGSIRQEGQQLVTGTRADGWYALCNVPVSAIMELRGVLGADTSGAIAANLVGREVVRRDLYVGPTVRISRAPADSAARDRLFTADSVMWRGPARLAGTIRGANGRPIAGARVSLIGSESTALTNDSGGFVLNDLPAGSQTVQARALGFVPEQATVHLLTGEGAQAHQNVAALTLTTLRAVLDTIRVTASQLFVVDVNGFESRKRAGIGHF